MKKRLSKLLSRSPLTTHESGQDAQRFAEKLLRKKSYTIVATNLSDKQGELDIVARHKDFDGLVVVEVRAFSANTRLRQEEVLPRKKQEQVVASAHRLLPTLGKETGSQGVRFDALLVTLDPDSGRAISAEHFENAFTSQRRDWF